MPRLQGNPLLGQTFDSVAIERLWGPIHAGDTAAPGPPCGAPRPVAAPNSACAIPSNFAGAGGRFIAQVRLVAEVGGAEARRCGRVVAGVAEGSPGARWARRARLCWLCFSLESIK